jgi:hypothetical protein
VALHQLAQALEDGLLGAVARAGPVELVELLEPVQGQEHLPPAGEVQAGAKRQRTRSRICRAWSGSTGSPHEAMICSTGMSASPNRAAAWDQVSREKRSSYAQKEKKL